MAGVKSLIGLALSGTAGMTLLIMACTIHYENWLPAFAIILCLISPLPILVAKHLYNSDSGFGESGKTAKEWAYFFTSGIVISTLALPIEMARCLTITILAASLSIMSSIFFFITIFAFFIVFQSDDYSNVF